MSKPGSVFLWSVSDGWRFLMPSKSFAHASRVAHFMGATVARHGCAVGVSKTAFADRGSANAAVLGTPAPPMSEHGVWMLCFESVEAPHA